MRLVKPAWVNHKDGKPIFSIDIHPDGSRFATGGQGDDAGKIIIWNMAPVRSEEVERNESIPKILCEMDNHLACVNCVRWSGNGRYLASGGDDKLVLIWEISRYGAGGSVFGSDSKIVECWRPTHTLRGHAGDVLDLAWAPGDIWLATCSIDNTVIIWNAEKMPEQVAVLKGHTGLVKGVTWDPVGKYVASQSDDKSLRIWRTRDWQQEAIVTEPFKECGGTTHVLRCDWSPDGHYVVSAHAMNNSGPTAQIVERDGWKTSLDFVGHRKAITVVRFNPGILSKKFKKDLTKPQQYTCCAIGSRDRSLSIWLTALKRPLVVTHDLFNNSILDISWASSGTELMCCSCDGTVAYIQFKQEEIGTPMSRADKTHLLEKIYGKTVTKTSASSVANQIIESADILKLQQQRQKQQQNSSIVLSPTEKSKSESNVLGMVTPTKSSSSFYRGVDMTGSPFKPTDKQIETKTPDGRRRITPIFLPVEPDVGGAPAPFTGSDEIQFQSSKGGSSIQVERQDKVTQGGLLSPQPTGSPMRLPNLESTPKSNLPPPTNLMSPLAGEKTFDAVVLPLAALDKESPKVSQSPKVSDTSKPLPSPSEKKSLSSKRKHDKDEQPRKRGRPRLVDKDRARHQHTIPSTPPGPGTQGTSHVPEHREPVRHVHVSHDLILPAPAVVNNFSVVVLRGPGDGDLAIDVDNSIPSGGVTLNKVKVSRGGNTLWQTVMSAPIIAAAGSRFITIVACTDCSLSVFNDIGQRVLPSIILPSKVAILDVLGQFILAVSCTGSVYVWNLKKKQCVVKNEQLSGIIKGSETLSKAYLAADGTPVIVLSNHKAFTFSVEYGTWLLIQDRSDKVAQSSSHFYTRPKPGSKHSGTLSNLPQSQDSQRVVQCAPDSRQLCTLNHLESQVMSCLALKSPTEYKFWMHTYVRYLVQEGVDTRLRQVCTNLIGPVINTGSVNTWESTILGLDKRALLRELLPLFSENLKTLQRLYTEIQEQLDMVDAAHLT
ncbi:protein HIRA-like [Dreissena polymorpha]|uniref:Protein HIRA n=1 Tax=Dreissena polymorpha TaxID=45954 RepID=A0A9D4S853_DREPO|nr:protein HIRA-like [Dreissena polymorpha]KAH3894120.1 hypothetical protein DPMN_018278 [Dreissena polymorpha]